MNIDIYLLKIAAQKKLKTPLKLALNNFSSNLTTTLPPSFDKHFKAYQFFTNENYIELSKKYDALGFEKSEWLSTHYSKVLLVISIFSSLLIGLAFIIINLLFPEENNDSERTPLLFLWIIYDIAIISIIVAAEYLNAYSHFFKNNPNPHSHHIDIILNEKNEFLLKSCLEKAYIAKNKTIFKHLIDLCFKHEIFFSSERWNQTLIYAVKLNLSLETLAKIAELSLPFNKTEKDYNYFKTLQYAVYTGNLDNVGELLKQDKFIFAAQASVLKYIFSPSNTLRQHIKMMNSLLVLAAATNPQIFNLIFHHANCKNFTLSRRVYRNLIIFGQTGVDKLVINTRITQPTLVKSTTPWISRRYSVKENYFDSVIMHNPNIIYKILKNNMFTQEQLIRILKFCYKKRQAKPMMALFNFALEKAIRAKQTKRNMIYDILVPVYEKIIERQVGLQKIFNSTIKANPQRFECIRQKIEENQVFLDIMIILFEKLGCSIKEDLAVHNKQQLIHRIEGQHHIKKGKNPILSLKHCIFMTITNNPVLKTDFLNNMTKPFKKEYNHFFKHYRFLTDGQNHTRKPKSGENDMQETHITITT